MCLKLWGQSCWCFCILKLILVIIWICDYLCLILDDNTIYDKHMLLLSPTVHYVTSNYVTLTSMSDSNMMFGIAYFFWRITYFESQMEKKNYAYLPILGCNKHLSISSIGGVFVNINNLALDAQILLPKYPTLRPCFLYNHKQWNKP